MRGSAGSGGRVDLGASEWEYGQQLAVTAGRGASREELVRLCRLANAGGLESRPTHGIYDEVCSCLFWIAFSSAFLYNNQANDPPYRQPTHLRGVVSCSIPLSSRRCPGRAFLNRTALPAPAAPSASSTTWRPILKENCFGCHGTKKPQGQARQMTKFGTFQKGGTEDTPFHAASPTTAISLTYSNDRQSAWPPSDVGDGFAANEDRRYRTMDQEGAKLDAGLDDKADLYRELAAARWSRLLPAQPIRFPVTSRRLAFYAG